MQLPLTAFYPETSGSQYGFSKATMDTMIVVLQFNETEISTATLSKEPFEAQKLVASKSSKSLKEWIHAELPAMVCIKILTKHFTRAHILPVFRKGTIRILTIESVGSRIWGSGSHHNLSRYRMLAVLVNTINMT